jgi:hypothetical protein
VWTWDAPVNGDSLQGWWPRRRNDTSAIAGDPDWNRPFGTLDFGNVANYTINEDRGLNWATRSQNPINESQPGWRTVGVMPGNDAPWQQSESLGYDRIYDANDLGYRGPRFSWASMPDQYTLFRFEHTEHAARTASQSWPRSPRLEPCPLGTDSATCHWKTSVTAQSSMAWPKRMTHRKPS